MTQHVPGNQKPERPLAEQADILTQKLTGHKIFARQRGSIQGFPMTDLLDLDSKSSPTASLREFNRFVSDIRVMRNLVVWLRSHDCRRAAEELVRALSDEEYRIWCEDVPFDAMTPGVLLMFEPEEMLPICRWWDSSDARTELCKLYLNKGVKNTSPETRSIIRKFPGLTGYNERDPLFSGLMKKIIGPFLSKATTTGKCEFDRQRMRFVGPNYPLYTGKVDNVNQRDGYQGGAFAYFFPNKDQAEVLGWFPRKLQGRLATWQLNVPNRSLRGTVQLRIGLYPESEHALWSKLAPSLVSKGFSAGVGAIFEPKKEFLDGRTVLFSW